MARPYFLRPLTGALLGLVLSLFILSSGAVADPPAATYSFTILEVPGAINHPTSINASGQVAGYYYDGSGATWFRVQQRHVHDPRRAGRHLHRCRQHQRQRPSGGILQRWLPSTMVSCTATARSRPSTSPGAIDTDAPSINDSGQVAGTYSIALAAMVSCTATARSRPSMSPGASIRCLPASTTAAKWRDITTRWLSNMVSCTATARSRSSTRRAPLTSELVSINDSGQVAGTLLRMSSVVPAMVSCTATARSRPSTLPGATSPMPSASTTAAKWRGVTTMAPADHGFVYSNGTFTTLDPPGATYTIGSAASTTSGQVTGDYSRSARIPAIHGFIATPMVNRYSHPEPMGAAVGRRVAGGHGFAGPSPADPRAASVVAIRNPKRGDSHDGGIQEQPDDFDNF